ncbi:DUF1593 domain-containing protein [Novosphingobium resinovorum]
MKRLAPVLLAAAALGLPGLAKAAPVSRVAEAGKPRVIVLTDIGSDPDDMESMVRFLLYTNEFEVEALVPSTSRHLQDSVHPEQILKRIDAYEQVLPNLRAHAQGWPSAAQLRARVRPGRPEYGMLGVGAGKDTEGSRAIVAALDKADPRPVWICVWGGAVDLAQALWSLRETRPAEDVARLAAKLRVYSISDQDNAGPWVRRQFPDVFWIVSLTAHRHYNLSTWGGISGDRMYYFDGPDFTTVSKEWLRENVQIGPLGSLYPNYEFIMEGTRPASSTWFPTASAIPSIPTTGTGAGVTARCPNGTASGPTRATSSPGPTAKSTRPIRRRSGAGARRSRTTLRRASSGRCRARSRAQITHQDWHSTALRVSQQ